MTHANRTFSYRALVIGVCATILMAVWIHFHEVLVPGGGVLAENSPPVSAIGVLLAVIGVSALLAAVAKPMRLQRGELVVIYTMLVVAAPIMSQGMWHRFLGLMVAIPHNKENMPLLADSFSEKLWPHGQHLVESRRFEGGLAGASISNPARVTVVDAPASPVGATRALRIDHGSKDATTTAPSDEQLIETHVKLAIPRAKDGEPLLIPGEKYYLSALVQASGFSSRSSLSIDLRSDGGSTVSVVSVRRDTTEGFTRAGRFERVGQPYVAMPRDVTDRAEIVITMAGPGTAQVTDIVFFSNEALERLHKGSTEVDAENLDELPDNSRESLNVRPSGTAARGWYYLSGYIPYRQWITPMAYWGSIVVAIFVCLLGIGVILRKQWVDNERFSLPMIVLPKLLIDEQTDGTRTIRPIYRSVAFKVGVALTFLVCFMQGMAFYVPGMPDPTVNIKLAEYFSSPAMKAAINGFYSAEFRLSLLFVAIAFFVDLDLLLSILIFMVLARVPFYLGEAYGWKNIKGPVGNFPFPHEQHIGSFLCLALMVVWTSRKHLAAVGRRVLGMAGGADDADEPMRYRTAAFLIVASLIFIAWWGASTGLGAGSAMVFFGFLIVCGLSAARIRTECGAPMTYFTPYFPFLVFYLLGGLFTFGMPTMVLAYVAGGFMAVAQFLLFAPTQIEMMQLARTQNASPRAMPAALMVGILLAVLVGGYVMLVTYNGKGGDNVPYTWAIRQNWYFNGLRTAAIEADAQVIAQAAGGAGDAGGAAAAGKSVQAGPIVGVGVGAAVTLGLTLLRAQISGFWLHPLGFILANTYFIYMAWGPILVAWVVKWLALKVGGPRLIREQLTPGFAGVFVGGVIGIAFWNVIALINMARGVNAVYVCWPGG